VGKLEIVSYSSENLDSKVYTYPLTRIRSWKLGGKVKAVSYPDNRPLSLPLPHFLLPQTSLHPPVFPLLLKPLPPPSLAWVSMAEVLLTNRSW
jgi:hypothetical protein